MTRDSDIFLMSKNSKGIIYEYSFYSKNEEGKKTTDTRFCHQSHENVCNQLKDENISLEDFMFICFLTGNESIPGLSAEEENNTQYKNFVAIKNAFVVEGKEALLQKYGTMKQLSEEEVKSRYEQFLDYYVLSPRKLQSLPSSLLYKARDITNWKHLLDIKSSYNFSGFLNLIYSWVYKLPVPINPYNREDSNTFIMMHSCYS